MRDVRAIIQGEVHKLVGFGEAGVDLSRDPGDPGLFGPGSVAWRVHGDFTSMMIGGIASLLLQMLHPGALAGVWDHSNFREDREGRLRRTAQFIAATTYGSTAEAERLIARVRRIHAQVRGTLPDGEPYSADDPELLTWVHVAEVTAFLRAYLRYKDPRLGGAAQDRYFAETAEIARRLGAVDVPEDRRAIARYLRDIRPALRFDARTREVSAALTAPPPNQQGLSALRGVFFDAAIDLLPDWAARLHGFDHGAPRRAAARIGAHGLGGVLRWALTDGSSKRAARRLARA